MLTKKQIIQADDRTINILSRIHKKLDCSVYDSNTKTLNHYGISEDLEKVIFEAIEEEMQSINDYILSLKKYIK